MRENMQFIFINFTLLYINDSVILYGNDFFRIQVILFKLN